MCANHQPPRPPAASEVPRPAPTWSAATSAAAGLTPDERALLVLLARLPLVPSAPLARVYGARCPSGVRRALQRLAATGLVDGPRPAAGAGRRARRLWHLTDLGLATLAVDRRLNPAALARLGRLRRQDLLAALGRLPTLLALYDLLAALATAGPGRPRLLGWTRPWRGHYPRPRTGTGVVRLPAYAAFTWRTDPRPEQEGDDTAGVADASDPCADFLLVPDLGTLPLAGWRETLGQLLTHRAALARADQSPPLLVVTTPAARRDAWLTALSEACHTRGVAPLPACVTTWEALDEGLRDVTAAVLAGPPPFDAAGRSPLDLVQGPRVVPPTDRVPGRAVPRLVGGPLTPPAAARSGTPGSPTGARPGQRCPVGAGTLDLRAGERALLDLVARHPFLPREGLAAALGWEDRYFRRVRKRLLDRGLARLVRADEPRLPYRGERAVLTLATRVPSVLWEQLGLALATPALPWPALGVGQGEPAARQRLLAWTALGAVAVARARLARATAGGDEPLVGPALAGRELLEATAWGLHAVAAWQGLTLSAAVRVNGLAGGGPERPHGARDGLLATLEHTLGVDALFVALMRAGREATAKGRDAALVEWRNAAVCARQAFRPDGYGVFRREGRLFAFLLEYDRGTMRRRDWAQKLGAYYDYRDGGRYRRDYHGFPLILVVTATPGNEDLLARVFRELAVGRQPLPVLLTTRHRLGADREGLLGRIWRDVSSGERGYWLAYDPQGCQPGAPTAGRPGWQPRAARRTAPARPRCRPPDEH